MNVLLESKRIYERRITELEERQDVELEKQDKDESEEKLSVLGTEGTETIVDVWNSGPDRDVNNFGAVIISAKVANEIAMDHVVNDMYDDMNL